MVGTPLFTAKHNSEMNVIPMLDILLVLLMIFMVSYVLPLIARIQLSESADEITAPSPTNSLVLELPDSGGYLLNGTPVPDSTLEAFLAGVYEGRPVKSLLIAPGRTRRYREVIEAMDRSYGVGVEVVGLMPPRNRNRGN